MSFSNPKLIYATQTLKDLCRKFEEELLGIFPKPEAPPDDEQAYSEVSEGEDYFTKGDSTKEKSDGNGCCKGQKKRKKATKKVSENTKEDGDIGEK